MLLGGCTIVGGSEDRNIRILLYFLNMGLYHFTVTRQEQPLFFMAFPDYRNIFYAILLAFSLIGEDDPEIANVKVWSQCRNGRVAGETVV